MLHQKCIELLLIEVYKYLNGLCPDIMKTIFKLRQNTYNLKHFHAFESRNLRTKEFALDSIAFGASQLWKNVPEEIRNSASLLIFKWSLWFPVRTTVVKLTYMTRLISSLFKFGWIYLSTSCSPDLRIYLTLCITKDV